ncbi:hypothetical protein BDK51DRAFT_32702 [Blyttiomyces helicus]|uniref:Uncharacterized protein n=1 Tax=Blyttiomyces helicus TaxID=388810 RepID=A0A4P9W0Q1_9FUNG|nr:hypothetical protein BDK51DRAFT_32702 [Blyttiomyces helicus]|eukprot:RKO84905.1 hypothetical protein BDK51DRAFT_32702 [Blyttiomyces helicus]
MSWAQSALSEFIAFPPPARAAVLIWDRPRVHIAAWVTSDPCPEFPVGMKSLKRSTSPNAKCVGDEMRSFTVDSLRLKRGLSGRAVDCRSTGLRFNPGWFLSNLKTFWCQNLCNWKASYRALARPRDEGTRFASPKGGALLETAKIKTPFQSFFLPVNKNPCISGAIPDGSCKPRRRNGV